MKPTTTNSKQNHLERDYDIGTTHVGGFTSRMNLESSQLFSLGLIVVILCSLANCKQVSPNNNNVKLKEVERLYANLPIHQSFQETGGSSVSKPMLASVGKRYKSDARWDDVKNFYVTKLIPEGWQFKKEIALKDWSVDHGGRQLTFTRDQYSVAIEYRGDKAIDPDWNYAIDVGWDSGRAW